MPTLRDLGELGVIRRFLRRLPGHPGVIVPPGDDCAVVRMPSDRRVDWLLTSDPVIETVHFAPGTPPKAIGHKAVGRVLSDIAAMGGEPCWILLDYVAPGRTPAAVLDGISAGAASLAARHGAAIVGGDTAEGPSLEVHAFAVGRVPRGQAVARAGASPHDGVYATGRLGGSAAGRHLTFEPRLREGAFLRRWASAMIDLSDGLASDLMHIADMSRVDLLLETPRIPVSFAARRAADALSPAEHALYDGEDFELAFTVPRAKERAFVRAWHKAFRLPCTRIGTVTARARAGRIFLVDAQGRRTLLRHTGFQHFRRLAD